MTNIYLRKLAEQVIEEASPVILPPEFYVNRIVEAMDSESPSEQAANLLLVAADMVKLFQANITITQIEVPNARESTL